MLLTVFPIHDPKITKEYGLQAGIQWQFESDGNQTRSLPEGAHEEMSTTEFYEQIGEELERALASE